MRFSIRARRSFWVPLETPYAGIKKPPALNATGGSLQPIFSRKLLRREDRDNALSD
jgi:hypothetical protein